MKVTATTIPGVLMIEPRVFADERGAFFESFNTRAFAEAVGHPVNFVQDNQSTSLLHVLRGLHFQEPHRQGKLVRALSGSIYDVAADIRPDSPTFGTWVGVELSAENRRQLWVPEGLAHGFLVLSETADVLYKQPTSTPQAARNASAGTTLGWPSSGPSQPRRYSRRGTPPPPSGSQTTKSGGSFRGVGLGMLVVGTLRDHVHGE